MSRALAGAPDSGHLFGIDPHSTLIDKLNRPVPLIPYGDVVHEMLP
jgi:hypothetical protein